MVVESVNAVKRLAILKAPNGCRYELHTDELYAVHVQSLREAVEDLLEIVDSKNVALNHDQQIFVETARDELQIFTGE